MCSPERGHNRPEDVEREAATMERREGFMERRMANGNGRSVNGWIGRFVDDAIRLWPVLLVLIGWGVRVEVFMQKGDRFTPDDGEDLWRRSRAEFVEEDVYGRDREHLAEDLQEIKDTLRELRDDVKTLTNGGGVP
jgi:hypothetical protein